MVMRVGSSLRKERERRTDEEDKRAVKPKGAYKEVPRPSRRLALATRQKNPYKNSLKIRKLIP